MLLFFRLLLYRPLQHLLDNGVNIAVTLCEEYSCRVLQSLKSEDWNACEKLISVGISLGKLIVLSSLRNTLYNLILS